MRASAAFFVSVLAFAAASMAQVVIPTPGSTVKIALSANHTSCLGAPSARNGAEVVLGDCSALPFSTYTVIEGLSTSSATGFKFTVVGTFSPTLCLSARGAGPGGVLEFDLCLDSRLQLFEYVLPDNELLELVDTGSCVTSAGGEATIAACSAPESNPAQQWVFLSA